MNVRSLNVYQDVVKTTVGDSWETHKSNVTDMMIKPGAINIKNGDMQIILIMKLAATTMMVLRMKQIAAKNEMDFQFPPIQVQYWELRKKKKFEDMQIEEALDAIIYGIDTETCDSWETTPRTSNQIKATNEDDEGRCERILEKYFNEAQHNAQTRKRVKKKIGKLFNYIIQFLTRNELVAQNYIWVRQQAPAFTNDTPLELKEKIMSKSIYPNFRIATFTVIGRYENEMVEKQMTRDLAKTLRKIHQTYQNAFQVKYIATPSQIKSNFRMKTSQRMPQK